MKTYMQHAAALAVFSVLFWQNAAAETQGDTGYMSPYNAVETPAWRSAPSSFQEMLLQVYLNNPRLNSERESLKVSDEKVSQANAGYRPTLNADAAYGRQREKVGDEMWQYGEDTSASLTAIQPIFSGFSTLEQKRAAEARVLAERAHLLSVEQNILFTAITDWLELCEKEKTLALTNDNLQRMHQYANATQARFKAGDGTETDIAQAESRTEQAEARYAMALADRDSARATLERDTGLTAATLDFPQLPAELPASLEEAEKNASNNPQLTQAMQEEKAADHDIDVAGSSLWPNVYLRGNMSEEHSPALGLDRLRDDSLTINVSIPLYQGGGEYSRIREAKLTREKSRYDAIDISRDVLERARISWNSYQSAKTVIDASQKATDAAGRALDGVQEEQKQGLRTLTEVLDEQSELLGAEITQTQAQKNVRLEAYRLLAATGRLTGEGLRLTETPYDPLLYHDDVVPRWVGTDIYE